MSEHLKNKAVLETADGISQEFDGKVDNIPESSNYTVGSMKSTSFYIVYELPYYNRDRAGAKYAILENTTPKLPLGFKARSIRGFNSDGIVLIEYFHYGGPDAHNFTASCDDISKYFPSMAKGEGVSSVIVKSGDWYLLTRNGGRIPVPGTGGRDHIFTAGHNYQLEAGNDQVFKVQRLD